VLERTPVLSIAPEPFDSDDARRLVAALDAHLSERYPPAQRFGPNLRPEQIADGRGIFIVARFDGVAVGCGALRMLGDGRAEVKRMYVEPRRRGQGIAAAVLERLEATARELGARRLVLETGDKQAEAIALYRRHGFTICDCWGEYAASPTSVCMEKHLAAGIE